MTGEELYLIFAEEAGELGISMDDFDELEPSEQVHWNAFAKRCEGLVNHGSVEYPPPGLGMGR